MLMDFYGFPCCWRSSHDSWSSTFLCRVVKGFNFVWVFSRPKQPEGEEQENKGGHSKDVLQNTDENNSMII